MMHQSLRNSLDSHLKISDENWEKFLSILDTKSLHKKDYLLRQGQVCRGIYFLAEGCLRTYHITENGKEINTSFYFKEDFIREIESLTNNEPSKRSIQALESCTVFYIEKTKLMGLYEESTFFQKLGRMILERLTISEQQYSSLLTAYSPKERYMFILENQPELVERIPLQYLASYLGISRESLSRIRKRV